MSATIEVPATGEWLDYSGLGNAGKADTSVPSDGIPGFVHGAIFQKVNGTTAGDAIYINTGSATSCAFRALDPGDTLTADVISEATPDTGVTVDGVSMLDGSIYLTNSTAVVFDTDGNSSIGASANDVLTVTIGGAADFTFGANVFTALSGSSIATNTIIEASSTLGVTIDSVLLKDGGITIADGANIILNTTTGTKIGTATAQKLGFYNATPVVQPTALTAQLTAISHTTPGTPDYAIQDFTQAAPFGFVTANEANTVLSVILNLQARLAQVETALESLGLVAAN